MAPGHSSLSPVSDSAGLRRDVGAIDWYHTVELGDGVVTPGLYDHRRLVDRLPLPASLAGRRCLDVGSADGFWAFEMARRGAAQVVSLDVADLAERDYQGATGGGPDEAGGETGGETGPGTSGRAETAFAIARDALGLSNVERVDLPVYDLTPSALGHFDMVFVGNLLLHLSDPARALHAVRGVTHPDGRVISFEPVSLLLSVMHPRRPVAQLWGWDDDRWWTSNVAAYRRLLAAGGLELLDDGGILWQRFGPGMPRLPRRLPPRHQVSFWLCTRPLGVPSWWALARPARGSAC